MVKSMTIGKKLRCGFGAMMIMLCLIVLMAFTGVSGIVTNASKVIDGNKLDGVLAQREVDHLNWVNKVNALLNDETVTELAVQTDDHKCGFGKWLYGEGREQAQELVPSLTPMLKQIEKPHADLHASAIKIGGQFHQADEHFPKFLTEKEVDHLKWKDKCDSLFQDNLPELVITTDDHKCGLGKFLYGPEGKAASESDTELANLIDNMKEPHGRLHTSVIAIQDVWQQNHPGLTDTLRARLDDHRKWSAAVSGALLNDTELNVQTDPTKCAFGKWLAGSESKQLSSTWSEFGDIIAKVKEHHLKLHESAIKIASATDSDTKIEIFKNETTAQLNHVASLFSKAIELEDVNNRTQTQAQDIFTSTTVPALKDTQAALSAVKERAVAMLDGMTNARQTYASDTLPALHNVQGLLADLRKETKANIMTDAEMLNSASRTKRNVGIMGTIGIVAGLVLAFMIARSIVIALTKIIHSLSEGSAQVASASSQVSESSQSLAEGASEQAAGLEEASSGLEEVTSMTRANADNAQKANTFATDARKSADMGSEAMGRMNGAIEEIQKSADETAKIIKVIDEIAFQTNLLALNAAVEAARAGEAGKGFAVVAEEVRNLAMRSAEAAKNTSYLIEGSVKNSKNGVDIAEEVGKVFNDIVEGIGKTSELVGEFASASTEHAQSLDDINNAVTQIDQVTQSNAANSEQSASASEELNAQAETMNQIVEELSILVGVKRDGNIGSSKHKGSELSYSDNTFHQIADGRPQKAHAATKTENSIPLDDSDFEDFNS